MNDTWAYEVFITRFNIDLLNYELTYKVRLYDHFGLDHPDMENDLYSRLAGFRSWFILQHYHNYRPFVTAVEFEKTLKGNLKFVGKTK